MTTTKCKLKPGFTHRYGGRRGRKTLQPGDTLDLTPEQMWAFRDRFEPVEAAASREKAETVMAESRTHGMYKRHAGSGKYNVYKSDGTKVNDIPLTMAQADEMMK